jgi:CO dehydrogenase maturation factor
MVIAVAGKGGVGKTTVAGMLIRYLVAVKEAGPVLAIDADPNANLNEVLGVGAGLTIGSARESLKRDVPQGMSKDAWFEYKVNEAVVEGRGFDLVVMGRPEGPGCYCAANSLAKKYIEALRDNYSYVVVDNEAGMEHMSRLVTKDVERLLMVSDPAPRGLMTAHRIRSLIAELDLNIGKSLLLVNRVRRGDDGTVRALADKKGIAIDGMIHEDGSITEADVQGRSVFEIDEGCEALAEAYRFFDRMLDHGGAGR